MDHPLSDDAILKLISDKSFIGCCGAGARCFHKNFTKNQLCTEEIDANAAIKTFRSCREETRMLTVLERNSFLLDNFKGSIKSILLSDSTRCSSLVEAQNHLDNHDECFIKEFRHEFKFEDLTLCRYSWAFCMGYSNYELDKCSRILKDNTAVEDIGHKPFTDSFLHQTSYGNVEEVFMDNIVSVDDELAAPEFVGKQLFIITQLLLFTHSTYHINRSRNGPVSDATNSFKSSP